MSLAIGIDLGTTYSSVGIWQNGKVEIITNEKGNRKTASCVAFTGLKRLVGDEARGQSSTNPINTIFDAKRLIGRRFNDPKIQADMKQWPFRMINEGGRPKIEVEFQGQSKKYNPTEISSMVLMKMREIAEAHVGHHVKDAVITVPAHFNDSQRRATKEAGARAGLNVLRIMNDPSAAAYAYGLNNKNLNGERNILIFDLGGGTLDVSIVYVEDGTFFEVVSTAGNAHLGGEDFDSRLVQYFCNWFNRKYKKNLFNNPSAMRRLRTAAERAKETLSSKSEATLYIKALHDGVDFNTKISRTRFEEICADLFKSTLEPVEKALKDAKLDRSKIADVVLVGGSSRIPKIRSLLQHFFDGKKLNLSINADEAATYGAAVQAAILTEGDRSPGLPDFLLVEVHPLSFGIASPDGVMKKIIKHNGAIPSNSSQIFTTTNDDQRDLTIQVYEGENHMTRDNNFVGTFTLTDIAPAPRGTPRIQFNFDLDLDGIIDVSAKDAVNRRPFKVSKLNEEGQIVPEKLARMLSEAEREQEESAKDDENIEARNRLITYVHQVKETAGQAGNNFSEEVIHNIINSCDQVLRWLEAHKFADKEEYQNQANHLAAVLPRWQ